MPNDKIVLTNLSALHKKYGDGFARVQSAITKFIAADYKRGLQTRVVAIDSEADMKALKGTPVLTATNQRQVKAAVDAVCEALQPDYLLILGAPDVVPMQELRNPMEGDGDAVVPSDLPYACAVPFSTDPKAFLGPTRVVGRMPDLVGQSNPAYLVRLLGTATRYRSRPGSDYHDYFGVSAQVWQDSTARSLMKLFGSSASMEIAPPRGPKYPDPQLARRIHFINCHGSPSDPNFYGQRGNEFPKAHSARLLPQKISNGTVIAAECCYGAQLYDPSDSRGQTGICSTYLFDGAYGFFGSSTVAYGPSEGNGQADYICQYFVEALLGGASLGRATLEARQRFAAALHSPRPLRSQDACPVLFVGRPLDSASGLRTSRAVPLQIVQASLQRRQGNTGCESTTPRAVGAHRYQLATDTRGSGARQYRPRRQGESGVASGRTGLRLAGICTSVVQGRVSQNGNGGRVETVRGQAPNPHGSLAHWCTRRSIEQSSSSGGARRNGTERRAHSSAPRAPQVASP